MPRSRTRNSFAFSSSSLRATSAQRQSTERDKNSLAVHRPDLKAHFDADKNAHLRFEELSVGSGKLVWWTCEAGHTLKRPVHARCRMAACPKCFPQASLLEIFIYEELRTLPNDCQHQVDIDGYECDILIPSMHLALEVDGRFWHRNKANFDLKKNRQLAAAQIELIRVREHPLKPLSANDIQFQSRDFIEPRFESFKLIIERLMMSSHISSEKRKTMETYLEAGRFNLDSFHQALTCWNTGDRLQKSLAVKNPLLAQDWHPTKNGRLTPSLVIENSGRRVWWKCQKDPRHEWAAPVYRRSGGGRGCPVCEGLKIIPETSLACLNPALASQWHPTKNGNLLPIAIGPESHKKVWWQCSRDFRHEWGSTVKNRTRAESCCPYCAGRKVTPENCLASKFPDIAAEWHPTKNGELRATEVTYGAAKEIWWQCSQRPEHFWQETVNSRTSKRTRCPLCPRRNARKDHSG